MAKSSLLCALAGASIAAQFPFQIQVGNSAYVLYPNITGQHLLPDQSTLVLNFTTSVRGYSADADTIIFIDGPSLDSVITAPPYHNVTDTWDIEAAIVNSANSSIVHAFIHREHGWETTPHDPDSYHYNGYITYAESEDRGYSFQPWPTLNTSVIITSAGAPDIGGPNNTGTGPHWAVTVTGSDGVEYIQVIAGDYYAVDDATGQNINAFTLARSKMSDGGKPGTWLKWYNGSWSQPGLGGLASAIPGLVGAKMVWLADSGMWLAVGYYGSASWTSDPEGITGWAVAPSSLFPPSLPATVQPTSYWSFDDKFYYQSLIPGWGGNVWHEKAGDSLNLFYAYIAACNGTWGTATRGLTSAQLSVLPRNTSAVPGAQTTIAPYMLLSLSQYVLKSNSSSSSSDGDEASASEQGEDSGHGMSITRQGLGGPTVDKWATVWPVDQRTYDYGWHIAYVLASEDDWAVVAGDVIPASQGLVPVVDCYIVETNDHFTARLGECTEEAGRAGNQTRAFLGSIGYLLTSNTTGVPGGYSPMSMWRCYDPINQDHYLAPLYGCQSTDLYPTMLGYALGRTTIGPVTVNLACR